MKKNLHTISNMSPRILFPLFLQAVFSIFQAVLVYNHVVLSKSISAISANARNQTDIQALMAFKSMITQDPQGVMSSWNNSVKFCQWEGVTCSLRHERLTYLNLSSKGLVGSLSPQIGNLSFLQKLWLDNNTFDGVIPSEIGRLSRLEELRLSINSLGGEIPASISNCSNLRYLNVYGNSLVGRIPHELGSLSKLKNLWVHVNNLTGEIPPSLGNITSLESLSATYNFLVGSIPQNLGQLRNLIDLDLGANHLSGFIHPSLYNLSHITTLTLAYNKLQGSLPLGLGLMFPQLQYLQLSGNQFTGPLPVSLANASRLWRIDMAFNGFNGKINVNFGGVQSLTGVSLGGNKLGSGDSDEMSFLASLANCSNLQVLELGTNQLRGILPPKIQNFSTQLFYLSLRENSIYGSLPLWLSDLVGLTQLLLDANELTGIIPVGVGNLRNLQRFSLDTNKLSGELPASIGNLSLLTELTLNNNGLQGVLPPSLGDCQSLILLDLSENNFQGTIPMALFAITAVSKVLNLSYNHFSGSLPVEVGRLTQLSELDISRNSLSAELPTSIGSCTSLVSLYLAGNFFQGSIPSSLAALKGLQTLDLSSNNFSGQIPEYLETLALSYLNLSYNDLEGEVPTKGAFSNSSAVSVVGNNRLCGGLSEFQLPRCEIGQLINRRKTTHYRLVLIITIPCFLLGILLMYVIYRFQCLKSIPREPFYRLSYDMLLKATDGFSSTNLVGAGSFGSVYKGVIEPDQRVVAIKVLDLSHRGASQSFMAECETLRNIRHRNLVKVITSCSSIDFKGNDFKALVYEFMPNGNLDMWLHYDMETKSRQPAEPRILKLEERISIAIDVACALEYLHKECRTPVIHCDLKPSNILLDGDMVAHVGDFGLARFLQRDPPTSQSISVGIRGTIGYTPPEYGMLAEVSQEGDIYSYGILLLEIMTGKRPTDPMFTESSNLHTYAKLSLSDRVTEIVDQTLLNDNEDATPDDQTIRTETGDNDRSNCLVSMIKLGVACSMESPSYRMDISNVIHELHSIRRIFLSRNRQSV